MTIPTSASRPENLQEFRNAVASRSPLPDDIQTAEEVLQRTWYEEHDQHAKPWSM